MLIKVLTGKILAKEERDTPRRALAIFGQRHAETGSAVKATAESMHGRMTA